MKRRNCAAAFLALLLLLTALSACGGKKSAGAASSQVPGDIAGTWTGSVWGRETTFRFGEDGAGHYSSGQKEFDFTYVLAGGALTVTHEEDGYTLKDEYTVTGGGETLTLSTREGTAINLQKR